MFQQQNYGFVKRTFKRRIFVSKNHVKDLIKGQIKIIIQLTTDHMLNLTLNPSP